MNMFLKFVVVVALAVERAFSAPPQPSSKVQPTMAAMIAKSQPQSPPAAGASSASAAAAAAAAVAPGDGLPEDFAAEDAGWGAWQGTSVAGGQTTQSVLLSLGQGGAPAQGTRGNAEVAALRRLCLLREARVRQLEAAVYTTVKMSPLHPAVVAATATKDAYYVAAGLNPRGHGQGPPHGLVASAFLKALAMAEIPTGLDPMTMARFAVVFLVTARLLAGPFDLVLNYVDHFNVAVVPTADTQSIAIVQFAIQGTVSLPDAAQLTQLIATIKASFSSGDFNPVFAAADSSFLMEDGIPFAAGARGHDICKVLTTVLCSAGATKATKAPRGGAAKALAGKGKGKGKGKIK